MPTFPFSVVDYPGASDTEVNGVNNAGEAFGGYEVASAANTLIVEGFFIYNGIYQTVDIPNATYTDI